MLHPLLLLVDLRILELVLRGRGEDEDQHAQAHQHQERDQHAHAADLAVDFTVGNDDGHRPARLLHRSIEDIGPLPAALLQHDVARLAREHGVGQHIEMGRVLRARGIFLDGRLHIELRHGADHNLAFPADQDAERIRIDPHVADQFGEPVQRDVGRQHRCDAPRFVHDRYGIGRQQDISAAGVDIGLGPVSDAIVERLGEPLLRRIVILCRGQGLEFGAPVRRPADIGGEKRVILVVAGHEREGGAHHGRVLLHDAARHDRQAVGIVEAPAGDPHAVVYGRLGLVHDIQDLVARGPQLALRTQGRLLPQQPLRGEILDEHRRLQRDRGHDYQQEPRSAGPPDYRFNILA